MSVDQKNSHLEQKFLNEFFGYELRSTKSSAKRDFSESIQAALSSGLSSRDLQIILDAVLNSQSKTKEVQ